MSFRLVPITSRVIGSHGVVLLYGLVLLEHAVTHPHSWGVNAWKFAFSVPVALIVLSIADRLGSTLVTLAALGALIAWRLIDE